MEPHLVLLNWKVLTISLSVNMLQKSIFNPKHDLREKAILLSLSMVQKNSLNPKYNLRQKWLDANFKVHKTSARKVLTVTKILSTVLWLFLTFFTGWIFVVSLSFSCVQLAKKCCRNIQALRDLNFWMFFPDAWLVKLVTPMFDISKLFWQKLHYACHLLCVLLSHSENLLSLSQTSLNKHLFSVFADIL